MAHIYAFREDRLGFSFNVDKKAVLGRAPECEVILFDKSTSRAHAEIFQTDSLYYIADLGSTNGTMVNEQLISIQTRLDPFDTIKIGQELFVFEPGLNVIVGSAPTALIIMDLAEEVHKLTSFPIATAAAQVAPGEIPVLMNLVHNLAQADTAAAIEEIINRYLHERFGMTFMAVLWPSLPPVERLSSLMTSHEDKRLLLSQTPFLMAIRDQEAVLWPNSISELSFSGSRRHVSQTGRPSLVGPLYIDNRGTGLMYLENLDRDFTENDLKTFSALLSLIGPAVDRVARIKAGCAQPGYTPPDVSDIILSSSDTAVKIIYSTAAQAAVGSESILLSGETGTGKAALAEYIHRISPRRNGRLVTADLPAMPASEMENLLFGTAPTADNESGHIGLIEKADCGTLFLRHVEFLSPRIQKMLLSTLEEGLFFPVGSARARAVDLRLVSSTSIDLWAKVESGYFREDLYSRINHVNISTSSLRESKSDLEGILTSLMNRSAKELGLNFTGLDRAALECLRSYNWPGNISELKTEAAMMVLFSRNGWVSLEDLPLHLRLASGAFLTEDDETPTPLILEAERQQLIRAMSRCGGNLEDVAELLKQRPENVILKMRSLGLDPIDYQAPVSQNMPKGPGQTSMAN